jgi:hypothetical protein
LIPAQSTVIVVHEMPPKELGVCKCNWLTHAAEDPKCPVEFDSELNEFHIVRGPQDHMMIYYCPFCGGAAPKSKRDRLFHTLTDVERDRLVRLTKDMRTLSDVIAALGEPDLKQSVGIVVTNPERDGKPETTQSYPTMTYKHLSETADVCVTIYPTDQVGITFQGKPVKKSAE